MYAEYLRRSKTPMETDRISEELPVRLHSYQSVFIRVPVPALLPQSHCERVADVVISCYNQGSNGILPTRNADRSAVLWSTLECLHGNNPAMKYSTDIIRWRQFLSLAVFVLLTLILSAATWSQERSPYVFHPEPKAAWSSDASVGLRVLAVPRDIAEEELNRAPALDFQLVIGLPLQLSLASAAEFQFVTNHFRGGLRFSHCVEDICLSIGDDVGFWFGFVDFEGFDNSMRGWMNFPNATLGYSLSDVRLSLRGELIYTISQRSFAGENEIASSKTAPVGGALSFILEQPLLHDMHVVLGIRLSLTEFHHQTWFAFSAFKRKLLYSELLFAVLL